MGKNDEKISEILKLVNDKKSKLGEKPRSLWRTNGILKYPDGTHLNINTVQTLQGCADAIAYLLRETSFKKEAALLVGIPYDNQYEAYLEDFKFRATVLRWDEDKKKLDAMENQLKALRSEDAKTADAIEDIMRSL